MKRVNCPRFYVFSTIYPIGKKNLKFSEKDFISVISGIFERALWFLLLLLELDLIAYALFSMSMRIRFS